MHRDVFLLSVVFIPFPTTLKVLIHTVHKGFGGGLTMAVVIAEELLTLYFALNAT